MDEFNEQDQNDLDKKIIDRPFADIDQPPVIPDGFRDEEMARDITPDNITQDIPDNPDLGVQTNAVIGWVALVLSIVSFFVMPIVFGAVAIIVGFIARTRDAEWLGNIAIAIGVISIIVRLFIFPLS